MRELIYGCLALVMAAVFSLAGMVVAYLACGVFTAFLFTLMGPAPTELMVAIVLLWPMFWLMAFIFIGAAA